MDTLWASLIGLFVIAIAVVLAFNLLQGRQTRLRDAWRAKLAGAGKPAPRPPAAQQRVEPRSEGGVEDAASAAAPSGAGERIEPTFGPAAPRGVPPGPAREPDPASARERPSREPPVPGPAAGAAGPREAAFGDAARGLAAREEAAHDDGFDDEGFDDEAARDDDARPTDPAAAAPDGAAGPILDPRLDCIVAFGLGAPIAPDRLLGAASTLRRAGSKPIAVEADAGDGRWAVPHASFGAVRRARAGVLLANRHGPLNAMEFSEFSSAMQALGRAIGAGGAIVPEMAAVLDHARQLDEACAQLDAVIGLNVETPTALSPGELAALASGLGLQERGNTRFAALDDDGDVLFSLSLGERAEQLTLLLDVPRAPARAEPWQRMVEAARACAERTGGRVVDDANRPLTEAAAAEVERQLEMRYRMLHEAGLDAGSPAALRVFN